MMRQTVKLNYLRMTPRKARGVATLISGLPVHEAEAQLMLMRNRAAVPILKLLRSGMSNFKNNNRAENLNFYIESARVDQGPMLKRFLPRARGSASPIQKKMSHVTLVLAENPNAKPPRFTIKIEKKEKLPKSAATKEKNKKEKAVAEHKTLEKKKPGFFRKIFSRKVGQ